MAYNIPSAVVWLASKYSRAQGQAARKEAQIERLEKRLEFHQQQIQSCKAQLMSLHDQLADAQAQARNFARAMEIHERAVSVGTIPTTRPHENARLFPYGGMNKAIFHALRSAPEGVLTIDELLAQLMLVVQLPIEEMPRFKMRLQMRLSDLRMRGKVMSPDPKGMPSRRWRLENDWTPSISRSNSRSCRPRIRSRGSIQPAHWLIRTQQEISRGATEVNPDLTAKLDEALDVISGVWEQHPLYFEIDADKCLKPRRSAYRAKVYSCIAATLTHLQRWMTVIDLKSASSHSAKEKQSASIHAIETALKQLLLEGRVERRQREADGQIEWRMHSPDGESISTSVRHPRRS
jgi:hypothetical protein